MKKFLLSAITLIFLMQSLSLTALAAGTRQDWLNAQQTRIQADADYKKAQADYQADKTPANEQKVVDTAKDVLNAALDEAEAWLNWKNTEAQNNADVPNDIKNNIANDVNKNLAKIQDFRTEVAGINTRLEVGIVFLKIVGAYVELLTDVARNTGSMWVYIANNRIDKAEDFEAKLRQAAAKIDDNTEILNKLDLAKTELADAQTNVNTAENAYKEVKIPGTPLIKFAEGNNNLRQAQSHMLKAMEQLLAALKLIMTNY